jgi:thioredoxin-related protein
MKILLSLLFVLTLANTTPNEWGKNFEQAKTEATQNNKRILINFSGSDWCIPCIKMKKDVFETTKFMEYAQQHLILVRADFPRLKKNQLDKAQVKINEALADRYNAEGEFPMTVLTDATGKVLKTWHGYAGMSPEKFIAEVELTK